MPDELRPAEEVADLSGDFPVRLTTEGDTLVAYGFKNQRVELPASAAVLVVYNYTKNTRGGSVEKHGLVVTDRDNWLLVNFPVKFELPAVREFASRNGLAWKSADYPDDISVIDLLALRSETYQEILADRPGFGLAALVGGTPLILGAIVGVMLALPLWSNSMVALPGCVGGATAGLALGVWLVFRLRLWHIQRAIRRRGGEVAALRPAGAGPGSLVRLAFEGGRLIAYGLADQRLALPDANCLWQYHCSTPVGPVDGLAVLNPAGQVVLDAEEPFDSDAVRAFGRANNLNVRDEQVDYRCLAKSREGAPSLRARGVGASRAGLVMWAGGFVTLGEALLAVLLGGLAGWRLMVPVAILCGLLGVVPLLLSLVLLEHLVLQPWRKRRERRRLMV